MSSIGKKIFLRLALLVLLSLLTAGCDLAFGQRSSQSGPAGSVGQEQAVEAFDAPAATATFTPTPQPAAEEASVDPKDDQGPPSPTPTSSPTPTTEPGPINPLTGLEAQNPANLCYRPLLVSVSNFPVSARPQAGLSAAAQIWETFIGEGMTRYLAIFYGDYAQYLQEILQNRLEEGDPRGFVIGPVRSGRVVFEDIKLLFERGRLVTAGASGEVAKQLSNRSSVYGSDPDDINSAGVGLDAIYGQDDCVVDPGNYATLVFDETLPSGGEPAEFLRVVYNYYNQVGWEYDPQRGVYLRFQDESDGTGELVPTTERLTGEQLGFANVVIMWAQHRYVTPTIIELELVYVRDRKGLLLRDGQIFDVRWSTRSGKLTIHDKEGNAIPLKPGATFFEVVSWETTWNPEEMIVRFHSPPLP